MDHVWAARELDNFLRVIDALRTLHLIEGQEFLTEDDAQIRDNIIEIRRHAEDIVADLVSMDPAMRILMEAARPGLGIYAVPPEGGWSVSDPYYWHNIVRLSALRAKGMHERGAEAQKRMRPDSPELAADQFHPWVWEAAAPMRNAGSRQESVHAAARSVNARLQQRLDRHDVADAKLCREAFSLSDAASGHARLRFSGDGTSETWRSRQNRGIQFGAGCFEGIRNPAAHQHGLDLSEQVALEQLAALSLLSRWIEECEVERA